jgi:hypothetical protein
MFEHEEEVDLIQQRECCICENQGAFFYSDFDVVLCRVCYRFMPLPTEIELPMYQIYIEWLKEGF